MWVLILSAEITLTVVSEYSSTASVFSSCAGRGALTSACIHCGASPATARMGAQKKQMLRTTRVFSLVTCARADRLQNNLLFIACPHRLKEIPQCRVVLLVR